MRLGNWLSTPKQLTMGLPRVSPLFSVLLQCLHKGTGGSEQEWSKPDDYTCLRRDYLQNSQSHPHSSLRCPGAAGNSVTMVPIDRVRHQSKQGASPVVHPQQQSSRTSNASSPLQRRSQNARTVSDTSGFNLSECWRSRQRPNQQNTYGCKKGRPALKAMAVKGIEQWNLFLLY